MFQELTGNGRVWIFTANRPLSSDEMKEIQTQMDSFCASWDAHGNQLKAQFTIAYNQVLVLAADEDFESASGCSIDKSTAIFKSFDSKFNLDLFNRMNLAFVFDNSIKLIRMAEINQAFHAGLISNESVFLDNTISTLADFKSRWSVEFKDSWAYRKVKKIVQNA
jgi:hypothetical protein